jgi:hypothetical protein
VGWVTLQRFALQKMPVPAALVCHARHSYKLGDIQIAAAPEYLKC